MDFLENLPLSITVAILVIFVLFKIWSFFDKKYTLKQLDKMSGLEFEYACAQIMKNCGFKKVKVTGGSGDYGVDITAQKDGERYAVQCKRYSKNLGNSPIQEVIGGMAFYNCTKTAVMTNQYFTDAAKKLAKVNGVELWDRDKVEKMLKNKFSAKDTDYDNEEAFAYSDTRVSEMSSQAEYYSARIISELEEEYNLNLILTKCIFDFSKDKIRLEFSCDEETEDIETRVIDKATVKAGEKGITAVIMLRKIP